VLECLRSVAQAFEPLNLTFNSSYAPVRQFAVKLVPARLNGERRIGDEVRFDKVLDESRPCCIRGGRRRGRRARPWRFRALACSERCGDQGSEYEPHQGTKERA